jgi:hypothetical protein
MDDTSRIDLIAAEYRALLASNEFRCEEKVLVKLFVGREPELGDALSRRLLVELVMWERERTKTDPTASPKKSSADCDTAPFTINDNGVRIACEELIGAGAYACVYRGTYQDCSVAVRIANNSTDADQLAMDRCIMASRKSTNLCEIYHTGTHGKRPYWVMELADAMGAAAGYRPTSLHAYARDHAPPWLMRPDEVAKIARALLRGVKTLWSSGTSLRHGDIKPNNIVRVQKRWCLADFGACQPGESRETRYSQSPTGVIKEEWKTAGCHQRDTAAVGHLLVALTAGNEGRRVSESDIKQIPVHYGDSSAADVGLLFDLRDCAWKACGCDNGDGYTSCDEMQRELGTALRRWWRRKYLPPVLRSCLIAAVIILAFVLGIILTRGKYNDTPDWIAAKPIADGRLALIPRVSPKEQGRVAFQVFEGNQTQLAVWRDTESKASVLTKRKNNGSVWSHAWAPNGKGVYYDRVVGLQPLGIYYVATDSTDESSQAEESGREGPMTGDAMAPEPMIKDAMAPEPIAPGDLIVVQRFAGKWRIVRWKDDKLGSPLGEPVYEVAYGVPSSMRVVGAERPRVFYFATNEPRDPDNPSAHLVDGRPHLLELNVVSGTCRTVSNAVRMVFPSDGLPLAVSRDESYLHTMAWQPETAERTGSAPGQGSESQNDLYHLVRVRLTGDPVMEHLRLPTFDAPWGIDIDVDGAVFMDLVDRRAEAFVFDVPEKGHQARAESPRPLMRCTFGGGLISLPNKRILWESWKGRKRCLMVAESNGVSRELLVDNVRENSLPAALVQSRGGPVLAFLIDAPTGDENADAEPTGKQLAIVNVDDSQGTLTKILDAGPIGDSITSLTALGSTLYFVRGGRIHRISVDRPFVAEELDKSKPRPANVVSVAAHPGGAFLLIVRRRDDGALELEKWTQSTGEYIGPFELELDDSASKLDETEQMDEWDKGIEIVGHVQGNAVNADGRVLVTIASPSSWFWRPGILDFGEKSAKVTPIRASPDIDLFPSGWTEDGQVLAIARRVGSSIYRLQPAAE